MQNGNIQAFFCEEIKVNLEYCLLLFFITVTQRTMMFYGRLTPNLF